MEKKIRTFARTIDPFNTSENRKKELINKGFVVETFFGDGNQMKNIALKKKIEFCLINKQVISIK